MEKFAPEFDEVEAVEWFPEENHFEPVTKLVPHRKKFIVVGRPYWPTTRRSA